jgi:type II secretory pathway component PulF
MTLNEEQIEDASQMIHNVLGISENSAIGSVVEGLVQNISDSINQGKPIAELVQGLGQQFGQGLQQQVNSGNISSNELQNLVNNTMKNLDNPAQLLKQLQDAGKPQETPDEARSRRRRERIQKARLLRRKKK